MDQYIVVKHCNINGRFESVDHSIPLSFEEAMKFLIVMVKNSVNIGSGMSYGHAIRKVEKED